MWVKFKKDVVRVFGLYQRADFCFIRVRLLDGRCVSFSLTAEVFDESEKKRD